MRFFGLTVLEGQTSILDGLLCNASQLVDAGTEFGKRAVLKKNKAVLFHLNSSALKHIPHGRFIHCMSNIWTA